MSIIGLIFEKLDLYYEKKINKGLVGNYEKHTMKLKNLKIKYASYDRSRLNNTRSQILEEVMSLEKNLFSNIVIQYLAIVISLSLFFAVAVLSTIPKGSAIIDTSSGMTCYLLGATFLISLILCANETRRLIKLIIFNRHLSIVDELLTPPYDC